MWSLIFLDVFTFYILCISRALDERLNKMLCILLIYIIVFLSAFQYGVGADYWGYVALYYSSYVDAIIPYPEISFRFFSEVLRGQGFSAQIIFFVYSLIINLFLYLTFKKYFCSYKKILLAYSLYVFCVFPGFYESLVTIRAMAASSILLYSSTFLYNGKIKYVLLTILAGLFHTVAFMAAILVFLPRIKRKKSLLIPIILGVVLNITGLSDSVFLLDLGTYSDHVNEYEDVVGGGGDSSLRIVYDVMLVLMLILVSEMHNNYYISIPLEFLAYGFGVHIAFLNMGSLITRIYQPFYIFIALALPNALFQKKIFSKNLLIIALISMIAHILFLKNLNAIYPFEFDLNFNLME